MGSMDFSPTMHNALLCCLIVMLRFALLFLACFKFFWLTYADILFIIIYGLYL